MEEKNSFRTKLHGFIDKLGTMALMNAMYLLACIPVLTVGPALNGLLTAIRYYVRGDKWFDGFKFGYKTRFLRSFLSWNIMLVPILYFLPEINHHWQTEQFVPLVASVLVFVLLGMFSAALQLLNVYVPTKTGRWLRNAADLLKAGNVRLAVVVAAFWLPLILFLMATNIFFMVLIIFAAGYFTLVAGAATLFLKANLLDILIDARADGVLLAEEGRERDAEDDEE